MMLFALVTIFVFLSDTSNSEWIEIPQDSTTNIDPKVVAAKVSFPYRKVLTSHHLHASTSTTSSYETLMKTPAAAAIHSSDDKLSGIINDSTTHHFNTTTTTTEDNNQNVDVEKSEQSVDVEDEDEEEIDEPTIEDETSSNTNIFSQIMEFLHQIQGNLFKKINSRRQPLKSVQSKIALLTNLKDDLLMNIDNRMNNLFVESSASKEDQREARSHSHHEEDHEMMDFPSNEGPLITIGFLTFAVFLIKLVLKLVYALKNKTNNNNGMVMTATTYTGRRKRDLSEDDTAALRILQLIDEFHHLN